jgi:branched-chain amino acid transport system ATP-binding protein
MTDTTFLPERAANPGAAGVAASVTPPVLEVRGLTVHHGQLRALADVSLSVPRGEVTAIIGSNGAGKSTLLRTIAGLHRPTAGSILLDGRDITAERPEKRVRAGIAMVPEGRRLFSSLSVEENLLVGATGTGRTKGGSGWTLDRAYGLFPWMRARRKQHALQLSGGEQQAVAIARALMSNPHLLLLDELSLGLAPKVIRQIYELIPQLLEAGVTVLLVEQDVSQAVRIAARIQCLLEGRTSLEGNPSDFTPAQIEAAYFGLGARAAASATGAAS